MISHPSIIVKRGYLSSKCRTSYKIPSFSLPAIFNQINNDMKKQVPPLPNALLNSVVN